MSHISIRSRFSKPFIREFFQDLREAIGGSERDFTQIPLSKAIILLSIPMVLEMITESVFALVDIFFVARLGAEAVATVGITESLMTIIYAIGIGISVGTTALVSRRIGTQEGLTWQLNIIAPKPALQSRATQAFLGLCVQ